MQEIRDDGTERLTGRATTDQIIKALLDAGNASVHIYEPGSILVSNGHKYYVESDGSLTMISSQVLAQASIRGVFDKVKGAGAG